MTPFFSIVVTCYNQDKYIEAALDSVLSQNYKSFECIVVDDGSMDQSQAIIQEFISKDRRFHLLQTPHSGQASARNAGMKVAKGEYILFLDGDDIYTSDCLSQCYEKLHEGKEITDLIIFGIQNIYYDDNCVIFRIDSTNPKSITFANGRELVSWYVKNHAILLYSSSNKAYKLDCLRKNRIVFNQSLKFGEDRIFNYEYLKFAGVICTIQKCFLQYRHINPNSLSSKFIPHYIDTALFLHDEKMKHLLPLADSEDEAVKCDFIIYDLKKEIQNAECMINENKDKLLETEYEEETNYLKKRVCEYCNFIKEELCKK